MKQSNTRQRVFLLLTVLWLFVIWGHSLMPAESSGAESNRLAELLVHLLPWMNDFIIRKIAHFTEYMILGGFLFGAFPARSRTAVIESVFAGFLAAFFDETIQLFTPGRSGQISDVWLDLAGFATLHLLCRGIAGLRKKEK